MSLVVSPLGHDDPGFLLKVNGIFSRILARARPRDVFVVQTTDCFGDRWCATGGRFLGSRDAQTVVSREVPMLPPFPPDRSASERRFHLALDFRTYVVAPETDPLHVNALKGTDYQRELSKFSEAGVFLWYSGRTLDRDRGTLMLQIHTPEFGDVWHATLERAQHGWQFKSGIGVSRAEFD